VYAGSHGFDIAGHTDCAGKWPQSLCPTWISQKKELARSARWNFGCTCGAETLFDRRALPQRERKRRGQGGTSSWRSSDAPSELRRINGKKVYELLPDVAWDKGKAVLWLLETLGLERGNIRPIYIGDDRTDEDAFRALEERGIGILVSEQSQPTAAGYSLKNPVEVERFLRALTARLPA